MKFTQVVTASIAALILIGCKTIDIKNGRVPDEYLPQAKKLEGIYRGEFNGVPGELVISFQGNKPIVSYRNNRGTDILNYDCASRIGNLLKVRVKGNKNRPEVSSALFAFDAGRCKRSIMGRDISLGFKETKQGIRLDVVLLKDIRQHEVCTWNPGNPPHVPPSQRCTWRQEPINIFGRFYR